MKQEELKTCLGQLLLDLRGNWAYEYTDRLSSAKDLCTKIEEDTSDVESAIESELSDGEWDGRIFRSVRLYGYKSNEGSTQEVKDWLKNNLTHPEHCDVLNP